MASWTYSGAQKYIIQLMMSAAGDALVQLLETKHLYQKVEVNVSAKVSEVRQEFDPAGKVSFAKWVAGLSRRLWQPSDVPLYNERETAEMQTPTLLLRNAHLFCSVCGSRQAFRPVWHVDLANEVAVARAVGTRGASRIDGHLPSDFQLLLLAYQCQGCQGVPEGFLIRREGTQLILCGRAPMEHIEVPPYIPKVERTLFRDAVIAVQAGKTLAALFYLRAFIEQFARRVTGLKGKVTGEVIMDAYSKTLPPAHRDQMPSLREWYERLSEALHDAKEDVELFENARKEIEHHFDIRRVFKIPEEPKVEGAEAKAKG